MKVFKIGVFLFTLSLFFTQLTACTELQNPPTAKPKTTKSSDDSADDSSSSTSDSNTSSQDNTSSTTSPTQSNIPQNSMTISQVTDNSVDDTWGANNFWKTMARALLFFLQDDDGSGKRLFVTETDGTVLFERNVGNIDVDFLAIGSGSDTDDVLFSWRENLDETFVSDSQNTVNLGSKNQEENSIDAGCLFYRNSTDQNDHHIESFEMPNSLVTESDVGATEDRDVKSSDCEAVWTRDGDLAFSDGIDMFIIENGPFDSDDYDFRLGFIVYVKDGDVFLVDTNTDPFTETQITDNGNATVESSPRTDGNVVVFRRDNTEILFYDISNGTTEVISTNDNVKIADSLQVDQHLVIWQEDGTSFFFHDGSGQVNGTTQVSPNESSTVEEPYLDDGIVTWYGETGPGTDTEIFVME